MHATVLVIDVDAGTGLFEWAESIGLTPLRALPSPDAIPAGTDLVVVDVACSATGFAAQPRLAPWRVGIGGGRRVLITAAPPSPGCPGSPPYAFFLSPRECLRRLALGAAGSIEHYAGHPHDYLTDCGEPPAGFAADLRLALGRDGAATLPTRWRDAIQVLRQPGRVRDLGDLTLVLVPASVNPNLALAAARCLLRVEQEVLELGQRLPDHPLLMLMLAGEDAPWESPGADPLAAIRGLQLFAQDDAAGKARAGWRAANKPPAYAYAWEYRLEPHQGDPTAQLRAVDEHLSALFASLLTDQRPLRHYGCTLFLPFDPPEQSRHALADALQQRHQPRRYQGDPADDRDTQALLYFLPHLRDLLYDQGKDAAGGEPIREWCLTDSTGWRLEWVADAAGSPPLTALVDAVRLLRYFNGIYLLALRVSLAPPTGALAALGDDGPTWWHPLAFADAPGLVQVRERALAAWLGFTRQARVIYPSFPEQAQERKIPVALRLLGADGAVLADFRPLQALPRGSSDRLLLTSSPGHLLSGVPRHLLACFFGAGPVAGAASLDQLLTDDPNVYDDRLFVQVAYGLAGPAPEPAVRGAVMGRLFSLALLVDRPADTFDDCGGYAYDPAWLAETLDRAALKIWEATGLYAGFTDLANAWLGAGHYFCETVAPRHVPYSYERMLILCLFYLASLRRYHRQVADATSDLTSQDRLPDADTDAFRRLRRDFICFTNRYWFHEVTPQLQGRRVFALQQQALGLEAEYQLIKDEMERAHEFLEAEHDHAIRALSLKVSTFGQWVAVVALWIGLTALWVAILPLIPRDGTSGSWWTLILTILPPLLPPLGLARWLELALPDRRTQGQRAGSPRKRR